MTNSSKLKVGAALCVAASLLTIGGLIWTMTTKLWSYAAYYVYAATGR